MTARILYPRAHATLAGSFLEGLLAPIDLLAEAIFAILIVLIFTLWAAVVKIGPYPGQPISAESMNELASAAFGAALAWGVIDGILYILFSLFERSERHRILAQIQAAETDEAAVDVIADQFDHIFEPITGEDRRLMIYEDMLAHLRDSRPRPVGFQREDFIGAAGSVLVAILAVAPSLAPLVLLRGHGALAIWISNIISFAMLFYAGFRWGRYTGANPWKIGLLLLGAAAIMVLIAVLLGG
jgi:VIT1/CCC1 family predicted Fe2+/Mn2+ transporter